MSRNRKFQRSHFRNLERIYRDDENAMDRCNDDDLAKSIRLVVA